MEEAFDEESFLPQEPERWRPPVYCPQCGEERVRLLTLRFEMSVYVCEECLTQFEVDEGE